jgi:hypothetical protein
MRYGIPRKSQVLVARMQEPRGHGEPQRERLALVQWVGPVEGVRRFCDPAIRSNSFVFLFNFEGLNERAHS